MLPILAEAQGGFFLETRDYLHLRETQPWFALVPSVTR